MHWIQRHILKELAFNDTLRYSALKPEAVEGNLFQYHARELERQGLIVRQADGYRLSAAGSQFVADLSRTKAMSHKVSPQAVAMILARRGDEYLWFRWRRHPYRGKVSLPFGRQFAGQLPVEVAADQLKCKSGYTADFIYVGLVSLISGSGHLLVQVFEAVKLSGEHGSDGLTGESFWSKPAEVAAYDRLMGTDEILDWAQDPDRPGLLSLAF